MEERLVDLRAAIDVQRGEVLDQLLVARSEIRQLHTTDAAARVEAIDRLLDMPQDQWSQREYDEVSRIEDVLNRASDLEQEVKQLPEPLPKKSTTLG